MYLFKNTVCQRLKVIKPSTLLAIIIVFSITSNTLQASSLQYGLKGGETLSALHIIRSGSQNKDQKSNSSTKSGSNKIDLAKSSLHGGGYINFRANDWLGIYIEGQFTLLGINKIEEVDMSTDLLYFNIPFYFIVYPLKSRRSGYYVGPSFNILWDHNINNELHGPVEKAPHFLDFTMIGGTQYRLNEDIHIDLRLGYGTQNLSDELRIINFKEKDAKSSHNIYLKFSIGYRVGLLF